MNGFTLLCGLFAVSNALLACTKFRVRDYLLAGWHLVTSLVLFAFAIKGIYG